ncbi:MAG: spore maturation protein [bacterium]|nr:spore maturation protein [bacterium]
MMFTKLSNYFIPIIVFTIIVVAFRKKVKIFDEFIEGAEEGLKMAIGIFPYLIAMIFGINILLKSGILDQVFLLFRSFFDLIQIPVEILPMAFIRPISGNASFAVMIDIFKNYGVDSYLGRIAAVMQGATDTTIYVISLYFGSIGIQNIRYALKAGLFADFVTLIISVLLITIFF